ncbi:MAG: 3-methyl-2-oxobutanoate hydroxymethyltransferase [Gammaproteobacteria bacterium]|nr:3-methyl-2-oxobutanoate hydroxymethyltransferase [Gammaproteobacteria bacterium]
MSTHASTRRRTLTDLRKMKQAGDKIVCLTAYDATFTAVIEAAGVDVILVGDSLGMVIQGHDSTLPVTMEDVIYHLRCVTRTSHSSLVIGDMPFMSYATVEQAITNAARLMQEGGAQMVKLEGSDTQVEIVHALASRGLPVCAHLGLQPQAVHKIGGYHVQGRGEDAALKMMQQSNSLEEAGADILLLECVPEALAKAITEAVDIPVIGIGAGGDCDGQILVLQDAIGLTAGHVPKFVNDFSGQQIHPKAAIAAYVAAVRDGSFPRKEHTFS